MKFSCITISLLACCFAFTLSSPSPPPPQAAPPLLPPVSPLPAEKDGVLPDGTVINSATDPKSCWTKPVDPPILGINPITNPNGYADVCRVCVIQNSTGYEPGISASYELWVRDKYNHAIGGIGPQTLRPHDDKSSPIPYINFTTGAKPFNMWSTVAKENPQYTMAHMVWDQVMPIAPKWKVVMSFNSFPDRKTSKPKGGNACSYSGSDDDGVIMYYDCWFNCY